MLDNPNTNAYSLQGNFVGEGIPDEIEIGDVTIPLTVTEDGKIYQNIGGHRLEEYFERLTSYFNQEVTFRYKKNGVTIEELSGFIQPTLAATLTQEGEVVRRGENSIDKHKPIKISWPVETPAGISYRDELTRHVVAASVVYKAQSTRSANPSNADSFPLEDMVTSHYADYEDGEIVFSEDDLDGFLYNSLVTIYVGAVRYRVNHDGDLVVSSTGNNTVISGGVQGGGLTRIQER